MASHKYIDKQWVKGKWQYVYDTGSAVKERASNFVDRKITGKTAKLVSRSYKARARDLRAQERSVRDDTNRYRSGSGNAEILRKKGNADSLRNEAKRIDSASESFASEYRKSLAGRIDSVVDKLDSKKRDLKIAASHAKKKISKLMEKIGPKETTTITVTPASEYFSQNGSPKAKTKNKVNRPSVKQKMNRSSLSAQEYEAQRRRDSNLSSEEYFDYNRTPYKSPRTAINSEGYSGKSGSIKNKRGTKPIVGQGSSIDRNGYSGKSGKIPEPERSSGGRVRIKKRKNNSSGKF